MVKNGTGINITGFHIHNIPIIVQHSVQARIEWTLLATKEQLFIAIVVVLIVVRTTCILLLCIALHDPFGNNHLIVYVVLVP
jgi:hypothetical protein